MASSIVAAPPPSTSWVESPGMTAGPHPPRSDPLLATQHAHFSPDFVVQNHPQPCAPGGAGQLGSNGKGNDDE